MIEFMKVANSNHILNIIENNNKLLYKILQLLLAQANR